MASEQFNRPRDGFRFALRGMNTATTPDALPPDKSPYLQNIRATTNQSLETRPGQQQLFTLVGDTAHYITDIRAYSALATDDLPRFLVHATDGRVWLDNGAGVVGSLSGGSVYATLIPFRPSSSPTPYMYIANGTDYQKFSAPVVNAVTQQKVGIAEPPSPPDAAMLAFNVGLFTFTGSYTHGGSASSVTPGSRVSDTAGTILPDPTPGAAVWSVQVSASVSYQKLMQLTIGGVVFVVQDVIPPLQTALTISAIRYFTGTTGRCIIVPANLAAGPGSEEQSIYEQNILATLRRGALIVVGSEVCLVWSVTVGPDGSVAIETSTVSTHTTGDSLTSLPTITVVGGAPTAGQAISAAQVAYVVTVGVGTQTATLNTNPFVSAPGTAFQPDDLISFGIFLDVALDNIINLTEMKLLIDVDDGSFTKNFYYYAVRVSDIAAALQSSNPSTQLSVAQTVDQRATVDEEAAAAANNQLQTSSSAQLVPGTAQWTQIVFPISALTRVGGDQTKSLQNAVKVQWLWNCTGTIDVATDNVVTVFGGSQPDVGDVGAPYLYRVRPRSVLTGVVGNPSPSTRYGVSARRASINVALPSAAYDPQIDTWDVFRYGGSITSWRFIGSTPSSGSFFTDNFDDSAATGGDALDFDNFEPWPSIDLPNNGTASSVVGTVAIVASSNANIIRYLPGTLVQLGDNNVFTLWTRPTSLGGGNYLLQFVENAGAGASIPFRITEPILARQFLASMWGPDSAGTVFAVGDSLRPGTVSFSKPYAPDSAPDAFNIEITPPSEPLIGGVVIDGLSFVASPERWWALYPQLNNPSQRYQVVQQPFPRGVIAPGAIATDGVAIYWWAKDGIYSSRSGSLTAADLFNLFPHDGVPGVNRTYNGHTVFAPDYRFASQFRLTHSNGYLYATYCDSTGTFRCLVCDLRFAAWSVDLYSPPVTVTYHPEQQAGTLATQTSRYPELVMASIYFVGGSPQPASLSLQAPNNDDHFGLIPPAIVDVAEFTGGDVRAPKQWGDAFVDLTPVAAGLAVSAQPLSLGAPVGPATTIPSATTRQRVPIAVGVLGTPLVTDFLGLELSWQDKYSGGGQTSPTSIHLWQPSFAVQPAYTVSWQTIGSAFGVDGFFHLRQLNLAWISTAAITITITPYDGQAPANVVLPSSSGRLQKAIFPVGPNKGLLFNFQASSPSPFQLYLDDSEVYVGAWDRQSAYLRAKDFGGRTIENAAI